MRSYEEPAVGPQGAEVHRPELPGETAAAQPARPESLTPSALLHLQRTAGNASVAQLLGEDGADEERSPVRDVVESGGGSPLDTETREFMETRLGHDFSDVRVHTDARASESARAVQANAYTVGRDVVFRGDQWSPGSETGRRMLAHELTHVVQQHAGPVDGTPAPGGIRVSDPSDRFEREADDVADRVMSGGTVQRQEEDEEEVQTSAVQRQEEDEEEADTGAF